MTSLRKFRRDVVIYGGADVVFKGLQFVVLPLYASAFTVAGFGRLSLIQVSVSLAGILVNLGVSYAIVRHYFDRDICDSERPSMVTAGLLQIVLAGMVFLLLAFPLTRLVHVTLADRFDIGWPLIVIGLLTVVPDQVSQFCLDLSRVQFRPWGFAAIAMVKNVAGLGIGLLLLFRFGLGVEAILIGGLAGALLAVPLGLWLVRADLSAPKFAYSERLLRFGMPFVLTAGATWLFVSMDRWLLASLTNVTEVGLYSIAFKFASVISLVTAAFQQAWSPAALQMARDLPDAPRRFSPIFLAWTFVLSLLAVAISLFARDILTLVTPVAYWSASPILAIAAAGAAVSGTIPLSVMGLTIAKRTRTIAMGSWIAVVANLAANLLLIPPFGAVGAALAMLVTNLVLTGYFLHRSQAVFRVPLPPGRLLFCGLLLGLALVLPAFLPHTPALEFRATAAKLLALAGIAVVGLQAGLLGRRFSRRKVVKS